MVVTQNSEPTEAEVQLTTKLQNLTAHEPGQCLSTACVSQNLSLLVDSCIIFTTKTTAAKGLYQQARQLCRKHANAKIT
jgi:hypothetical protein